MWKRRGKKRRLGFDLRSIAGPKDEEMKLKSVLGFAMAAFVAWGAFAAPRVSNVKATKKSWGYEITYRVSDASASATSSARTASAA